jgi:protein phosphatase
MRVGRAAAVTDTGRRRLRNEDAFVCEPPLFAVADGMGGARAGEVAARLAAAALEEGADDVRGSDALVALIEEANRRIWERSLADPETAGMGAVATVALVDAAGGAVELGHVGDSRAYLLRGGVLEQLTKDHSLVAELVESGVLTREEAERHPQRSAITRALGTEADVEIDSFTVAGEAGDLFLLCSDGLSSMVADEELAAAIEAADRDPARAADALVAAANARGGEDNITVVLFELLEGAEPEPTETGSDPERGATPAVGEQDTEQRGTVPGSDPERGLTPAVEQLSPSRHGAGQGGRIAALALLAALLVIAFLVLYTIIR